VAGFLAGISYAENNYPEWGHGGTAIGKYYAGGFADQAIGDYMTEAILPTLLHQDPRYYVLGKGGFKKRLWYAVKQEVSAYGDDGKRRFNTSEIAGNAIAAGISTAYYPAQERTIGQVTNKWGQQIYSDAFFNVLKEFWPDVRKSIFKQKD
jgi:hypothetical protein